MRCASAGGIVWVVVAIGFSRGVLLTKALVPDV
jgi:hypothetical protein